MPDLDDLLRPLVDDPSTAPAPLAEVQAVARRHATRRRVALGVAAALLVAVPSAAVVARSTDDDRPTSVVAAGPDDLGADPTVSPGTATTQPDLEARDAVYGNDDPAIPRTFDPRSAPAIHEAEGDPIAVASAYLSTQVDPGVRIGAWDGSGAGVADLRQVGWNSVDEASGSELVSGRTYLRRVLQADDLAPRWAITAITVEGFDLRAVANAEGTRLVGHVASTSTEAPVQLVVDGGDVAPVDGRVAPNAPLILDVPITEGVMPRIRIEVADGSVLGVLDVPIQPDPGPDPLAPATTEPEAPTTTTGDPTSDELADPLVLQPGDGRRLSIVDHPLAALAWDASGGTAAACPALVPADLGEGAGGSARATDRLGDTGWWIAFDLPGAPGEVSVQQPSPDAGTDVFSISAQPVDDLAQLDSDLQAWPNRVWWGDDEGGGGVGYGEEGRGTLTWPDGMEPAQLAYLHVPGVPCLYQVHTYLGEDHLLQLLSDLRWAAPG